MGGTAVTIRAPLPDLSLNAACGYSPALRAVTRHRPYVVATEGAVYVACSTLCFGRRSFEDALAAIAELQFNKFDVAVHEGGRHLRPSEVMADVAHAAARLRYNPGLTPCAFDVEIDAPSDADFARQLKAIFRLARLSMVPLVSIAAAHSGRDRQTEVKRLARLADLAGGDGIVLTVDTRTGTLTEDPDTAVWLCEQVPGLGLTLDPSHYLTGPHQGKCYDLVFPYVRHVHLRDTGRGANQFQVRVGQGEIEYGRLITQLERLDYDRALVVDVRDIPDAPFAMEPEVRKLKYLLESLV
jgi:sugar phosphate isomerase/epimerase